MRMVVCARRSYLYMPSSNARALEKARGLGADGYIFDLEDAVAPALKDISREQACAAVQSGHYGKAGLVVRINGLGTKWHNEDVRAVARAKPDAVLVPKINSAADVEAVATALPDIDIWCMIETPRAVLNVAEIAASHPRMTCLVAGTSDLVKDLHAQDDTPRTAALFALSQMICAARACDVDVLDGVYGQIGNLDGLEHVCEQGRTLGFTGKTLIHPEQIAVANRIFAPSAEQIARAEKIVAAYAQSSDEGVIVVDGQMIEMLHVEMAQRLLNLVKVINR
jgi:citrate lyase subunit beta / citryl-CoA lyase